MPDRTEIIKAAESDDLERLLALVSLDEIADAWWRYAMRRDAARRAESSQPDWDADPDGWAAEIYYTDIFKNDDTLRAYLRALAHCAPDDADLGYFGAAQLEDFITTDEERLDWIEQEAERSENFRRALANVWVEELGPAVFLRIQAAARTELVWHVNHGQRPMPDGSFADPSCHRSMT